MAFCEKCGSYIPIGETECPACGYDPETEARKAKEAEEAEKKRRAEEEKRRQAEAAAEEARRKAAEEEARRKARADDWAAQQRKQEEARRRAEEARRRAEEERRRQQTYTGGAAQSQYASQRTGQSSAYQSQYTSQRTGSAQQQWAPPWQETREHGQTRTASETQNRQYEEMRNKAADSAANQGLSVLSYLGPLFLIPLLTRKDDDFARYHANQGLSLFLVSCAANALGAVSGLFPLAGGVFAVYCMIKGIGNVLKGKKEPLPLIGNWKLIK